MISAYLRLQVPMYVTELVQLVHGSKHFGDVVACMLLFEDTRVVEQCTEISARHKLHRQVDVFRVLESV
jgi:hypothetical protein